MTEVLVKKQPSTSDGRKLIIVVGKNFSKKAVDRNRFKRRVRSIFRLIDKKNTGVQYTVIAKSQAKTLSFRELRNEITARVKD